MEKIITKILEDNFDKFILNENVKEILLEVTKKMSEEEIADFIASNTRKCNNCGNIMFEGFVHEKALYEDYYCSDECLGEKFTQKQWNDLFKKDEGYWTSWI